MAELAWSNEMSWWFAIAKWACFLGVWIEVCKALFAIVYLLRARERIHKAILLPFLQQPERVFVIGIMLYYYRMLGSYTPMWLQQNPEFMFVNVAYAGYWLSRAVPLLWYRRGRRKGDSITGLMPHESSTLPRPTPVR